MKIALPLAQEKLCMHFGHCEKFAIVEVVDGKVLTTNLITPPAHEPGLLPRFLGDMGVNIIIAGGMGRRAQDLFTARDIKVVVGAPAESTETLVEAYLAGTLTSGANACDH